MAVSGPSSVPPEESVPRLGLNASASAMAWAYSIGSASAKVKAQGPAAARDLAQTVVCAARC